MFGLESYGSLACSYTSWNGGTLPNDNRGIFKSEYGYDQKRWELARDAAKAVLNAQKRTAFTLVNYTKPIQRMTSEMLMVN